NLCAATSGGRLPSTSKVARVSSHPAFVQKDAYFTRANCPRCERHSKLYGYVWPKTQPASRNDKEERILDHRLINRFLDLEDEARARGKEVLAGRLAKKIDNVYRRGKQSSTTG
ncbi:uncharacterized protein PODANS_1_16460, partial [Podospora anserina S mat+]